MNLDVHNYIHPVLLRQFQLMYIPHNINGDWGKMKEKQKMSFNSVQKVEHTLFKRCCPGLDFLFFYTEMVL